MLYSIPSMEGYAELRESIIRSSKKYIDKHKLVQLKDEYAHIIDSVRTSEYIEDFEYFVEILERRDALRYDNITIFREIVKRFINDPNIQLKLNEYELWFQNYNWPYPEHTNFYELNEFSNGEYSLRFTNTSNRYVPLRYNYNVNAQNNIHCENHTHETHTLYPTSLEVGRCDTISNSVSNESTSVSSFKKNSISTVMSIIDDNVPQSSHIDEHKESNMGSSLIPRDAVGFSKIETKSNAIPRDSIITPSLIENSNQIIDSSIIVPLLSSPQSNGMQTHQKSSGNSVNRNNFHVNHINTKNSYVDVTLRRSIILLIGAFAIGITFTIIFFVRDFLKSSVYVNPIPSAPTFQEVHPNYKHKSEGENIYPNTSSGFPKWQLNQKLFQSNTSPSVPDTQPEVIPPSNLPVTNLQSLDEKESKIQQLVFERVSERLGGNWRDVARYLDVREYDIDNIETQHHLNQKEKAYAALKIFASESDVNYWRNRLTSALEKARRRDLREFVEELLSRKY